MLYMSIKVSVVVPVFNTEKYLPRCLDSLVGQTLRGIEVLMVDNNSTDASLKIAREYARRYPGIVKILECKKTGVSAARNAGMRAARGEYLAFCDSDDYVDPRMLELMYGRTDNAVVDLVVCDYYLDNQEGGVQPVSGGLENRSKNMVKNYLSSITVAPWNKLVRRSMIIDNELFFEEGIIYEDLAVVPTYILYAKECVQVKEPLYHYVCRSGSIINSTRKPNMDIFPALDRLYEYFERKNAVDKYRAELEFIYIRHLLHNAAARYLPYKDLRGGSLKRIRKIMKEKFPNWRKNEYYVAEPAKYRFFCEAIYDGMYGVLLGGSKIKRLIKGR